MSFDVRLLLADRSACLRYRVLSERLAASDEAAEVLPLMLTDPVIKDLLELQSDDGHWAVGDGAWRGNGNPLLLTAVALRRLALAGLTRSFEPVARGVEWLFSYQRETGEWPRPRPTGETRAATGVEGGDGEDWSPMQTAIPLAAIAQAGYAEDPRAERAYEWLLERRLDEGVWPTGWVQGDYRNVANYRVIAQSAQGCRSNTTMALQCFAAHPTRRSSDAAVRALDLLLTKRSLDTSAYGFDLARVMGRQPLVGFISHYARFDVLTVLNLAADIGADMSDDRVARFVAFAEAQAEPQGFVSCAAAPELSRWLTYETLRVVARVRGNRDWVSVVAPVGERGKRARRF